jgi:hypothetical protein
MSTAAVNCAWVRDRIAAANLTPAIEHTALLVVHLGFTTWRQAREELTVAA